MPHAVILVKIHERSFATLYRFEMRKCPTPESRAWMGGVKLKALLHDIYGSQFLG